MFYFPRELLHGHAIVSERPDGPDVSAHAATGHHVHLHAVFFQDLDDPNVRQAARAAGRQGQADAPAGHLADEPADVRVEGLVVPISKAHGGPTTRGTMNTAGTRTA